ncbi:tRNA pseudouridine synthase A [[Clostridium] ultunense Esp]|uniref:tRNA pseudouridine synthase A n=1 Tax=[Clostridium] ultunense Esp TaxID=1288971 RepID=M1Z647_9FIRM|nr:tRNA pseudouridine(38-40) synthase TruA [Schnuerera ultunensis]CCQ93516.1 tRNA pseudouridine synthase A [[Clostridium] ultunense Esp]SHD75453.1 tRNA pseudouridine (38-40) synthase [[Clostridium] ultunense Esp]
MVNIKLTIQYDGTSYCGWQKQKNGNSIQEEIERAIKLITGERVNLIGSGRTDSGVHAKGQVANFLTDSNIPVDRFKFALNSKLPRDISIIDSRRVDEKFHSRFDAIRKRYQYIIYNKKIRNPLYRNFAYHVPYFLNYKEMEEATKYFLGSHDFSSFMASNSNVKTTIRTIYTFTIKRTGDLIIFSIEGNGFLYNMVRIIIGTLVEIGSGKLKSDSIPYIIHSKNREAAGYTAPPEGLYLEKVFY